MSAQLPDMLEKLIVDGTKVGWYPERIAAWKRGERIAPVTIDCAMTRRCQAACSFCAPPGQEVLLESGARVPIENVTLGARVISAERWGCNVTGIMSRIVNEQLIRVVVGHNSCVVTGEHPIFTRTGYRRADELVCGDEIGIYSVEGVANTFFSPITSVERVDYSGPVYNLGVEGNNSYILNGIGVHNCYAQMQASESDIPIDRDCFFDFLTDAAEIGVKGVSFISDGESTVVPWYAEAVEHAAALGLAVGAGSNGIKLTRPTLERCLPHLSYLRFNFSAGEEARYAQIMGVPRHTYHDVIQNIKDGMEIIRRDSLTCTLNMQLVCDPKDADQLIPFARLCCELKPSYGVIKHCADDSEGTLGVDYSKYDQLMEVFDRCEELGREAGVRIEVKRSRLDGKRDYHRCYGPPFIMQVSGNGLVAPCGFLFNEKWKAFHIGNITRERFKDIWASDRYLEVMQYLASEHFDPSVRCGPNCLQHNTNKFLYDHIHRGKALPVVEAPPHMAFL